MFDTLPYTQEKTFSVLQKLELSDQAWEIINLSFRTRVKESAEEVVSFQFRLLPERITSRQESTLPAVREELLAKLQQAYPDEQLEVVLQVTMCCGSDCFGCRQFGR